MNIETNSWDFNCTELTWITFEEKKKSKILHFIVKRKRKCRNCRKFTLNNVKMLRRIIHLYNHVHLSQIIIFFYIKPNKIKRF